MVPLSFGTAELLLRSDGAVYWPREATLFVADLHLEKASFFASHGQPLPPYDSRATLERVAQAVDETGAQRVVTLGDNFHDAEGAARLEDGACDMLRALTARVDWVWITGNHDGPPDAAGAAAQCGGALHEELEIGGVICRHEARAGETRAELSGHWHPKLCVTLCGDRPAQRWTSAHGAARLRHADRRNGGRRSGDSQEPEPRRNDRGAVRSAGATGPSAAVAGRETRGLTRSTRCKARFLAQPPFALRRKHLNSADICSLLQESIP